MGRQPVKNNLIMTLEVIKRHSDVDHRLTQKNIQEYLQTDFELTCDRKTVKRNLMNLIEFGFDIEYTEIERKNGSQKSVDDVNVIITDIYYRKKKWGFQQGSVQLSTSFWPVGEGC